jgi:hypothetical protein
VHGECEYCGTQIRHSFLVEHEKWRAMEVGEQCSDKQDGIGVELVTCRGAYRLRVHGQLGERGYPTVIEARQEPSI